MRGHKLEEEEMTRRIEFYFDVGSPTSYLAWRRLPKLAERFGASLDYKPVLLGGIFKAIENRAPTEVTAKATWFRQDVERCAQRDGTPFRWNPNFPINSMLTMRAAAGLAGSPQFFRLLEAAFEGFWQEGLNMADDSVVDRQLEKHGLDPRMVREVAAKAETKTALKEQTEAAVSRGVFGCPTMIVGDRLAFGQDRLVDVEEALGASMSSAAG
jgi:2-hydroxychromene-2-carboxylate isomerase